MKHEDLLEAVKARLDIVEILSDYISLKKSGINYKGLCPFHSEKTPSFMVHPGKQIFHCFGCGTGGDMVSFVMKQEAMSFPEALKSLAKRAGIRAEDYWSDGGQGEKKEQLKEALKAAVEFYQAELKKNKQALEYLERRGISPEAAKRFSLGYAPPEWDRLYRHLKKNFSDEVILQSGAAQRGQKGIYDFLRNRIIFPICGPHGDVIAMGGRVFLADEEKSQPKYLNTSDSLLFKKGETLYGLDLAKDAVLKKGHAVLVEGYLDVIACHTHGFENAVAPLGTALTPGHLKKLKRFAGKIVLVFDGDAAGLSAAKRSLAIALEQDFRVKVAIMPAGEDPDSLLKAKGSQAFKRALGGSLTPMSFVLRNTGGTRVDVIRAGVELIAGATEPITREDLIKELSELGKIREEAIRQELKKRLTGLGGAYKGRNGLREEKQQQNPPFRHSEETLLASVFMNLPEKRGFIISSMEGEGMEHIREFLLRIKDAGPRELPEAEESLLARLQIEPGFSEPEAERTVLDCLRRIRLRGLDAKIKEARESQDLDLQKRLFREKEKLKGGSPTP
jgi:DNA primase